MDDPDITMEEYVQLETERALRNEFPAIVYNDALASKLDFSSKPTVSTQHVDEIGLKNEHRCPNMMKRNTMLYPIMIYLPF
ncbi:hypothetical protein Tco_0810365 [Tanacetum coccineum]